MTKAADQSELRLLCNLNGSELKHGGKASAGKEVLLFSDYKDLTIDEIATEIRRLLSEGFWVQVRIDAVKDKRKQDVIDRYPTSWSKGRFL